jgi:hypothetical protein
MLRNVMKSTGSEKEVDSASFRRAHVPNSRPVDVPVQARDAHKLGPRACGAVASTQRDGRDKQVLRLRKYVPSTPSKLEFDRRSLNPI